MKALITGGAGFIGSHLADELIGKGWDVLSIDNMVLGNAENVKHLLGNKHFELREADATDEAQVIDALDGVDRVFHLAANSDIQSGGKNPNIDFSSTLLTTKTVLEAMRKKGTKDLFFSSTSAVYGDKPGVVLREDTGDLRPISYYGACKLASEALISAYSGMTGINALIFRFPNVIGPRLTHGVIFDFIRKLKKNPKELEILGDGKQAKQYIYVKDLVKGIVTISETHSGFDTAIGLSGHRIATVSETHSGFDIFNLGTDSLTSVTEIADLVCERMGLSNVRYAYTGGSRGWAGDVPTFQYNIEKVLRTGWRYEYSSTDAVRKTLKDLNVDG
ncbi:MAG: NAD-dependent epimerase/dehydratase family protein [Candidatus Methanoplasma sp.]|jgi:UDP-glucose 4-epimerase|nr:NAD-dependent epimerase/dehydratase family protein [Candidatus Methanoplasma sp.]